MNSQQATCRHTCLDNNGTNSLVLDTEKKKQSNKKGLSLLLGTLQKVVQSISTKKNVRECSKFSTGKEVTIRQAIGGGNARFCGLNRCLNTTTCPRCAHMLGVARAKIIDGVAVPLIEAGGSGFMLTATIPHTRKDKFQDLRKGLNTCWDRLMRQKFGKHLGKLNADGKPLWVKSFDYTWGRNGDHLHFHALILAERSVSNEEYQKLESMFYDAWIKIVKKYLNKVSQRQALKFERVYDVEGVSKYNNKISSVAFEIASRGTTKRSTGDSYNIWELIWEYHNSTDSKRRATLKRKFQMFEKQTHKLRTISFSKCFREKIEEKELNEYKPEQQDQHSEEVLKLRTDLWKMIQEREDSMNLLELINCYGMGDTHLKPLVDAVEAVAEKYSLENDYYDEEQMRLDWGHVSWRIRGWIFRRFKPEL
ncbi:MAG: protein rep [Candidatus Thorarchaeota archaeon]|jgi:hypothetical protein